MKRERLTILSVMAALASGAAVGQPIKFDGDEPGKAPSGWTVAITGKGEPKWTVERDDSAPSKSGVLKQSAEVPIMNFPLCIKDAPTLKNGFVEVKFKSISGERDQAAGLVWRYIDPANYYVCRANALEDSIVIFKVERGRRTALNMIDRKGSFGVDAPVDPRRWHTLRVEFAGNRARAFFNEKLLFQVEDDTFKEAGPIGLWTKSDSVIVFDDFNYGNK
jgi:hypothetical protein